MSDKFDVPQQPNQMNMTLLTLDILSGGTSTQQISPVSHHIPLRLTVLWVEWSGLWWIFMSHPSFLVSVYVSETKKTDISIPLLLLEINHLTSKGCDWGSPALDSHLTSFLSIIFTWWVGAWKMLSSQNIEEWLDDHHGITWYLSPSSHLSL